MSTDKKPGTPKDSHYARLRRTHRDQAGGAPQFRPKKPVPPGAEPSDGLIRLYGLHTVRAALDNPKRKIRRMLVTRNALERLGIPDIGALPDELTRGDQAHRARPDHQHIGHVVHPGFRG